MESERWVGSGVSVVLTCCHGSYCTVSLFNKDVKPVCRASLDIINRLHIIIKLSRYVEITPSCSVFDLIITPPQAMVLLKGTF